MSLAGLLDKHEGALRASLQAEYGIRLIRGGWGRTEPPRDTFELADLVAHLPSGCALGRVLGGDGAISNESRMAREVEFTLRSLAWWENGSKGKAPERIPLPRAVGEVVAEQAVTSVKADAYARRQARVAG